MFKLIRDNIPDLMAASGQSLNYAAAQDEAFIQTLLRGKLIEEVNEYLSSADDITELVDVCTVIDYIIGDRKEAFREAYDRKLAEYGGFDKKYIGFFADSAESGQTGN